MSARPRHLGYVLKRFPRISETFVAAEILELERQGERVTVFALSRPEEPFVHGFVDELSAPVVYLPHRPLREPVRVLRALVRVWRASQRGWLRAARIALVPPKPTSWRKLLQATVLRDELERRGIDHLHAHFATAAARLASLARVMDGPTYSVTAHAKDIYHRDVARDGLRERLGAAAFVTTVSEANATYLSSLLDARRPSVVHNAVDLRRLGTPEADGREQDVVLTVARLIEKKGVGDLVAACGVLVRRGVPLRLEVVGDGPLRGRLEREATRAGVPAVFRGALPNEQVLDRYRRATVFCLPCVVAESGDRDGLPTSVLEAMALGLPVVTTSVNGLSEAVIHERTGLVVPGHDPASLADALERLLEDPTLRARLAHEARSHVEEHFALDRNVVLLRSLFSGGRVMRVAYLSTDTGIAFGGAKGAAVHVEELVRALALAGAEVLLLVVSSVTDAPAEREGLTVEVLPGPGKRATVSERLAAEQDRTSWLEERLRDFGPDVLYERFALYSGVGSDVTRSLRLPHFVELNAPLLAEAARYRRLESEADAERLERRTLGNADLVLVVSHPLVAYARERGARRVQVVPNGVDPIPYLRSPARDRDRPVAVFAGSLRPWHGIECLAEAWALLGAAAPELLVVGDGPGRALLERAGARITGAVPHALVPGLLAGADIGLAPYAADAPDYFSPLKLFEYLAAGLATIAGDLPGVRAVVDDKTAVLVPPGDAGALAAAVAALAGDPARRRRLGDAGRELVLSQHTWAHRAGTVLDLAEQYARRPAGVSA